MKIEASTPLNDLRQIDIIKIYNKKKCLIIDDFPEIRGNLKRTLRTFGAESVDTAADGEEAVRLCSQNKYDIVICDYNLGVGKDGQQLLEEVRFLRVLLMTSLFVMLTGETSREMVLGALECQPDDYITKPYTEASLKMRLNRAIIRHEALLPIKQAISDGDYRKAVERCNEFIDKDHQYAPDCIKMKGQLLFLLRQLKEAHQLYESVLAKKPLVWARLGMGKTLLAMGKFDAAENMLEGIIREDERYIEAHDLLADLYTQKNDLISAQKAVERATHVSPKSVHRHRRLAEVAELNGDDEAAIRSHQNAIRWGVNSCHESPQDYFNYARKVAEHTTGDKSAEAKQLMKQANMFLDRARKRYEGNPEVNAQASMVEAQMFNAQGNEAKAQEHMIKAKNMFNNLRNPSVHTSLEFARTLYSMNEEEQARSILTTVAARHPNDANLMRIIDGITGEPISDNGKQVAAKLTKTGITAYDSKDYENAINVFNEAIAAYPKHIGLNLNLVQAIVAYTEVSNPSDRLEKMCRRSMRAIGNIPPDHKQFKRYAFIQKQLAKYYPDAVMAA
ncbi:MAG TPA: tetratricopeptide repeat protein [Cellvibrionaceae bacterium]|nr:tetratricopeptide repeat protein [Cellvibrionaceae bacterium]